MSKPSVGEIRAALDLAGNTPESAAGEIEMARCLLYLHERNVQLERVYEAVESWLHSGLAEREHGVLLRALEQAREAERHSTHRDSDESLGL